MSSKRWKLTGNGIAPQVALWTQRSLIKSIQRGTVTITSSATGTAAITSVATANSRLRYLGFTNSGIDQADMYPRITLTNATTVTASRYDTSANSTVVSFEVVEYWPGVIRSVQRGTITQDAGPKTVNLATTLQSITKAELDFLGFRLNSAVALTSFTNMYVELISTTQVRSTSGATASQEIGYQVVEFF